MTRGANVTERLNRRHLMGGQAGVDDATALLTVRELKALVLRMLLGLLLALGCASADLTTTSPESTTYETLPATDGPTELLEALDEARDAWAAWGVESPHIAWVAYGALAAMPALCHIDADEGVRISGCWVYWQAEPAFYIADDVTGDKLVMVLTHELGHAIRGVGGHLKCDAMPGDDIMCNGGSVTGEITARDVAGVTGRPL